MAASNDQIREMLRQLIREELATQKQTGSATNLSQSTSVSTVPNQSNTASPTAAPTISSPLPQNDDPHEVWQRLCFFMFKTGAGRTIGIFFCIILALLGYIYFGNIFEIKTSIKNLSDKVDLIDKKIDSVDANLTRRVDNLFQSDTMDLKKGDSTSNHSTH